MPAGAPRPDLWTIQPTRSSSRVQAAGRVIRVPALSTGPPHSEPARGQPILGLMLEREDVDALQMTPGPGTRTRALAATHFGPPGQDKMDNEDFALAAHFTGADGTDWAVAVVADGVSTKTFWASRASRLAAFACLRAARRWAIQASAAQRPFSDAGVALLESGVKHEIRAAFCRDREHLVASGACPPSWKPDLYQRRINESALWYSTTLLAVVGGPGGAAVLICGDGAVVVERQNSVGEVYERATALETDESLELNSFVSLDERAMQFRTARVLARPADRGIRVFVATDGVDRSRANEGIPPDIFYRSAAPPGGVPDPMTLVQQALAVARPERDNHSLAILSIASGDAVASERPLGRGADTLRGEASAGGQGLATTARRCSAGQDASTAAPTHYVSPLSGPARPPPPPPTTPALPEGKPQPTPLTGHDDDGAPGGDATPARSDTSSTDYQGGTWGPLSSPLGHNERSVSNDRLQGGLRYCAMALLALSVAGVLAVLLLTWSQG